MDEEKQHDVDMGENGDDGEDDSSSSDEKVEMDPADEKLIMNFEKQLAANPSVYDTHVQLIQLLRKCKLRERLRQARQLMHDLFPFNESQWMDWINDEMAAISSQDDIDRIKALFQVAVQDYISVPLWESYLEFLKAVDPEVTAKTAAGAECFRQAAEAALTAAGMHLTEGHHIWQLYRAFEQELLDAAGGSEEKQLERLRALWHRQLQLPQASAAALLAEYEAWEASSGKAAVPDHIKSAVERSAAAAQLRAAHEAAVGGDKAPDASLLAAYMAYIQLEKAQKDPARVQLLYERALAVFPVTSELWLQYTRWLEAELKVPGLINKAYARAVRNCPWVGSLWAAALRAMERTGAPDEQHAALAEKALAAGMQGPEDYLSVLLARADCLRHQLPTAAPAASEAAAQLRAWFARARDTMAQYFADSVDRSLRLPGYWGHVEGAVLGDLAAMRAVWEEAVKGPLGRYCETWLAWVAQERALRQLGPARSIFKRAYSRKFEEGGQVTLAYEWLKFEREEGSAEELWQASLKVDPLIEEARAAAAAAANQPAAATARAAAANAKKLSRDEIKAMRRANDPNFKERKPGTKREAGDGAAADAAAEAADEDDGSTAPNKRSKARQPEDADMTDPGLQAAAAAAAAAERPHYTDEHTVFVKGLGFDVQEEDLRRLFSELGVKSVRIGRDRVTGASRGFAYVDFDTDDAVQKASQKDGHVVNGRTLLIAKSQPPGAGGRGRGRGRGRDSSSSWGRGRGRGDDSSSRGRGRGRFGEGDHHYDGGRGGGGFRGGRGGGGFRGGLGFHGGRGDRDAPGNLPHMRHHLQMGEEAPGHKIPSLVPRALLAKQGGQQQQQQQQGGDAAAAAQDMRPKTNEDFKKMLQK
ncbi:hypothetical protein OEZ86_006693 [Tetradesmus obliquus]|nr:hypothetical protein OEZ86_006693 [Tetradesmus obliquus]